MIKETVTYVDYDGVERTEDFRFNLTEAETVEMELGGEGSLTKKIQQIIDAKETNKVIEIFKQIMDKAYGVKSDDGRRFLKSPEILADFKASPAYSKLFMKYATDDNAASAFVNGIIPNAPTK